MDENNCNDLDTVAKMVRSIFAFNDNSLLDNHLEEMKKRDVSDSPS